MDRQVEQLSAGAGKALSSLWGWGATLAQRVEQAASSAAKELAETVGEAGLLGGGLQGPGASQLGSKVRCPPGTTAWSFCVHDATHDGFASFFKGWEARCG